MTMAPFNGAWFAFMAAVLAVALAAHYLLRNRTTAVKRRALLAIALANVGASIGFHLAYLLDPAETFPLAQNLPLHLCTLMTWLLPIAVWFDFKPLRAVCFFPGAVAGALALVSAAPMYWGHELFGVKTLFFVAHAMNAVIPALLASLGLYRPTVGQALLSLPYTIALALLVLPITLLMRAFVDPKTNYFFVFDPEGADILELFHSVIPVPLVYELPLLLVVLPVLLLEVLAYRLLSGRRGQSASITALKVGEGRIAADTLVESVE